MYRLFFLLPILFPFIFVAFIVAVAVAARQRRPTNYQAVPTLLQMGYRVEPATNLVPQFPFIEFGHKSLRVDLRITRNNSADTAFQFEYVVNSGENRQVVRLSCAVVPIPFWAPDISIWRGSEPMLKFLDRNRVEADSETFNMLYEVRSVDERYAYTALSYEVIEWFLHASPIMVETTVRMNGQWMMLVRPQIDVLHLPELVDCAASLRSTLPAVLPSLYPYPVPPQR